MYVFTNHALTRLSERTSITQDRALELLHAGIDLPKNLRSVTRHRMFWCPEDERAYIAHYSDISHEIITLYPAYQVSDDGGFIGAIYKDYDVKGNLLLPIRAVQRHDVRYCLHVSGYPHIASRPFFNLDREHRRMAYSVKARIQFLEQGVLTGAKTRVLIKTLPEEELDAFLKNMDLHWAVQKISPYVQDKLAMGLQLTYLSILVAPRTKSSEPVEPPIFEVEIEPIDFSLIAKQTIAFSSSR